FKITKSFFAGSTRETRAGIQVKNKIHTKNCEIDQPIERSSVPAIVQYPGKVSDKPSICSNPACPIIIGATTTEIASIVKNIKVSVITTPYIPPNAVNT